MRKIKIGSLTLALTLVALGVGALAHNLADSPTQKLAIRSLLDYWPLVLAVLGIEILVKQAWAKRSEDSTTSLDGASIFILLLIVAAVGIWQHGSTTFNWGFWRPLDLDDLISYSTDVKDSVAVTETIHVLELNLPGLSEVTVNSSETDQVEIDIKVTAYAPNDERAQELAEQVELETTAGPTLMISLKTPRTDRYERIEYTVNIKAPLRLALEIDNSRFGSVSVYGRKNDVEVLAQHSDIFLEDVQGDVSVENRFGRVEIRQITGNVEVDSEHGEILLLGISGSATVQNMFGPVEVDQITGDLSVQNTHDRLRVRDVGGSAKLTNSYDPIEVWNVAGDCHIQGKHSEVEVREVGGTLELETSYQDATLKNISGSIDAVNHHGQINLYCKQPIAARVSLKTLYDDIYVDIPEDSNVNIHAETRHGTISAHPPVVIEEDGAASEANGVLGSGEHQLWVETDNGDVRIMIR